MQASQRCPCHVPLMSLHASPLLRRCHDSKESFWGSRGGNSCHAAFASKLLPCEMAFSRCFCACPWAFLSVCIFHWFINSNGDSRWQTNCSGKYTLGQLQICMGALVSSVHLFLWRHPAEANFFQYCCFSVSMFWECGATYDRHSCFWTELLLNCLVVIECNLLKYSSNMMAEPAINCCAKMFLVRLQRSGATGRWTCWLLSCRLRVYCNSLSGYRKVRDTPLAMSIVYMCVSEAIASVWQAPTKACEIGVVSDRKRWNTGLAKMNCHNSRHSDGYLLLLTMQLGLGDRWSAGQVTRVWLQLHAHISCPHLILYLG